MNDNLDMKLLLIKKNLLEVLKLSNGCLISIGAIYV
jgi:hypothetical protein